jgi:hypothetical protein
MPSASALTASLSSGRDAAPDERPEDTAAQQQDHQEHEDASHQNLLSLLNARKCVQRVTSSEHDGLVDVADVGICL